MQRQLPGKTERNAPPSRPIIEAGRISPNGRGGVQDDTHGAQVETMGYNTRKMQRQLPGDTELNAPPTSTIIHTRTTQRQLPGETELTAPPTSTIMADAGEMIANVGGAFSSVSPGNCLFCVVRVLYFVIIYLDLRTAYHVAHLLCRSGKSLPPR